MSRRVRAPVLASLLLTLGCGDPLGPVLQPGELCTSHPEVAIATFADADLEAAVRAALFVGAQEDLTCGLVATLNGLVASGAGIESLAGIQNLSEVRTLVLNSNSIVDIGPLSGLTGLTLLFLSDNSITDVGPIGGLTNLRSLDLASNSIADITALDGLTRLTSLNIGSNPDITDVSVLAGLLSLADLDLAFDTGIADFQPLLDNPGLTLGDRVDLSGTGASCQDVAALEARQVTVVHTCVPLTLLPGELCSDNPDYAIATFEDASLDSAVRTALGLDAEDDLTCGVVAGLTELDGTGVSSVMGVQNLTGLTTLGLSGGSIGDVAPLAGLTELATLRIPFNVGLTDISPLGGLANLKSLSLDHNSTITDIGPLVGLTGLTALFLGANTIEDIAPLSGLTNLTILQLHENEITDVVALTGLTSLTILNLAANIELSEIQPLLDNAGLGPGDSVDLTGTMVNCGVMEALMAKGVAVTSDCS